MIPKSLFPKLIDDDYPNNKISFIGIDFGTSTTVISLFVNGFKKPKIIELKQKLHDGSVITSYKIPTMIAFYKNSLLFGEGANRLKLKSKNGKNLWHSFKMDLGTEKKYPYSELDSNHRFKLITPKDATTLFFKYLTAQIKQYIKVNNFPETIKFAISVPASFEANQRKDLLDSLKKNHININKQALIDEPNAGFISYFIDNTNDVIELQKFNSKNILVFDFGAGTCDISILEIGYNLKGFFSKNLAISRFEALGGNNIDELIAIDVLLPQYIKDNNITMELISSKKIIQDILPSLLKSAELLKININEKLSLIPMNEIINYKNSNDKVVNGSKLISFKEFFKIMEYFTNTNLNTITYRLNKEFKFQTIFSPILTAIKKAKLSQDDIDTILFIGGSAKSPIIQSAINNFFNKTIKIVPSDLQSLVSFGATIHSLFFNKFNFNVIEPITSEPIIIIIKDFIGNEKEKVIFPAGEIIPSNQFITKDLKPQKDGQKLIEFPVCIGNKNKILYNLKLENRDGFKLNSEIELILHIDVDKVLKVKARIDGVIKDIKIDNPFRNESIMKRDSQKFKYESEYEDSVILNRGKDNYDGLNQLANKYETLGLELDVAETLEKIYELYPEKVNINNIGLHYSNAGKNQKAMKFYLKAMDKDPSEITAFNIAIQYRGKDTIKYKDWLEKSLEINPNYAVSQYCYGVILEQEKKGLGIEYINKSFNYWNHNKQNLSKTGLSWFISCAKYLEKYDYVDELTIKKDKLDKQVINNKAYNIEYLASER